MAGGRTGAAQGALGAGRDVLHALAGQAPPSRYIRAYHGSPYDFDRVDMSMVGKGEGPLLEGFGLYATKSEPNAQWYRANNTVVRRRGLANVVRSARHLASKGDAEGARRMMEAAEAVSSRLQREFPRGRTYELELPFSRDQLLRWGAPLQEQPENVLAAADSLLGKDLRRLMERSDWRNSGEELYWTLAGRSGTNMPHADQMRAASESLQKAGVPGHVYIDEGATNFVAYPGAEDSIRILRKFGLMAPIAAGAAMEGSDGRR
jgi:hypothetical protein